MSMGRITISSSRSTQHNNATKIDGIRFNRSVVLLWDKRDYCLQQDLRPDGLVPNDQ
jgi:hypothetical protein